MASLRHHFFTRDLAFHAIRYTVITMPRKKKYTEFQIGAAGIFPPIVDKFLADNQLPHTWGADEVERIRAACFVAHVAARPHELESYLSDLVDGTNIAYFITLFRLEPDFALKLMVFTRKSLQVGFENRASALETAMAFLLEGAMQRFQRKKGREPSDGELSLMLANEHGLDISPETFGDARRLACRQDAANEWIRAPKRSSPRGLAQADGDGARNSRYGTVSESSQMRESEET